MIKEKKWTKDMEKDIVEQLKNKSNFDPNSKKPVYSIDTPPPYVNTPVHMGHAATYAVMDMIARFKRMTGHNVLFPLGLDRNGLPIEMAAEKKFGATVCDTPREEFIKLCKKVLEESSTESVDTFLKLGISFSSWEIGNELGNIYLTDSPDYRAMTQGSFIDLWKKGLIYEDEQITNFCPGCQTTIADAEIEYIDMTTFFNDITFKVKETGEEIIIGTTRPELICTCGMVIFNPKDERWKHLEGKTAITPIFEKEIPIQAHPMAEIDKGTGLVMMCSAGDTTDIRFFREMGITPKIAINKDGTMNENAGVLKGLKVKEARAKMLELLDEKGLLVDQRKMNHRTPICERSKDEIEFIAMKEFYQKQIEYKTKMKEFAKKINFYSPKSRKILTDWTDSISIDWPISRRRYYATEVPLWYCDKCSEVIVPEKGKYYQPWREPPPIKECPKCGSTEFRGEERVFDTWFDSSMSPLYILGYEKNKDFFEKNTPCSLRPQGKEIVRTWLYYTILKDYLLTGKCIFKDAWIHHHIIDEKGKKMSKSKGNIIDPQEIIEKFGAEPLRLWVALEGNLEKDDFRCSFERIESGMKTLTKLWNVTRFISMFDKPVKRPELTKTDEWILKQINEIADHAKNQYNAYDFHNPTVKIRNFLWETFSSHYLELVKNRAYNEQKKFTKQEQEAALWTLNKCLNISLKLLAPIIPLITHKLYYALNKKDVHEENFPESEKFISDITREDLEELNSSIWKAKKDANISLKESISSLTIDEKFKPLEKDLIACHNIKKLSYGKFKIKV